MAEDNSSGKPIIKAASACVWRGDEVLLIQRGKTWGRGFWSLPGGSIEVGEEPRVAAERELLEETGIVAGLAHHVGDFELKGPDVDYVISCWTGMFEGGEAVAMTDAIGVAWVRMDELGSLRLAFNNDVAIASARRVLGI
jgi:8-oxo-dGTP diphosphatase